MLGCDILGLGRVAYFEALFSLGLHFKNFIIFLIYYFYSVKSY